MHAHSCDFRAALSRTAEHVPYRPAINGLRGVAVLAVLGFHAFPEHFPGGYVGVDVFFVISGFLITSIIVAELRGGSFSFVTFYMRRVRRLFPALILVLVASLGVGWFVLLPDEFQQLGKHVGAAALFIANFAFWRESGYFDIAAHLKPLLHLWSLGIEEQFYLLWPLMLAILWLRRTSAFSALMVLVIGSFAWSVLLAPRSPVANFYLPFSRFWELGLGCALALVKTDVTNVRTWLGNRFANGWTLKNAVLEFIPPIGIVLIGLTVFLFDEKTPFPSWPTLLPVLGTLLILSAREETWFQQRVLGSAVLVWVGLISYALYLWHWPVLSFASILQAGPLPNAVRVAALLLSVVLAWLTYRLVEMPVRKRRDARINMALVSGAAVAAIAGLSVYVASGVVGRFDFDVQALRAGPRMDALCRARVSTELRFNYCRSTSADSPTILFLGDSRAQAIYEGAVPLLAREHSVMLLARGGCPPLLDVRIRGYDPNEESCEDVWQTFVQYVHRAKPDVVVVIGNGSALLQESDIELARGVASAEPKEVVFEYGLRALLTELMKVSRLIYIAEVPAFDSDPSCFLRQLKLPGRRCSPTINRSRIDRALESYTSAVENVRSTLPQLRVVNSVAVLCMPHVCFQRTSTGEILYRDAIHLSSTGGRILAEKSRLPELISAELRMANAE